MPDDIHGSSEHVSVDLGSTCPLTPPSPQDSKSHSTDPPHLKNQQHGQTPHNDTFGITPDDIYDLLDPKNPEKYAQLGGRDGMLQKLQVDMHTGLQTKKQTLAPDEHAAETGSLVHRLNKRASSVFSGKSASNQQQRVADPLDGNLRREAFGSNKLPEPVSKSLLAFMLDALKDKTLIVLCIAAAVEIAVGIYKLTKEDDKLAIIDGAAIIVAVLIVVLVASVNDYRKQAQFRKLNDFSKSLSGVKVLRDGRTIQIPTASLLVGDICLIETGDVLPADGVLVQGFNVDTDESSLTGEPINIHKDIKDDPFLLSGTKIVNGMGRMLVVATGVNSLNGRSMLALEVEPEETPLQEKLGKLADDIAKFGVGAATIMVVILIIAYFAKGGAKLPGSEIANDVIAIFITAITLVVVAVPEGLPLAVTLALAHATIRMLADKNLVRHLSACETMGNATTICSDKTGTLTLNKMTVTAGVITDHQFARTDIPDALKSHFTTDHKKQILQLVARTVNVNSTASESVNREGNVEFNGNKTEIAILNLTLGLGYPYKVDRERTTVVDIQPFSSERKRMSTIMLVDHDAAFEERLGMKDAPEVVEYKRAILCVKGASEIVLKGCDSYLAEDGTIKPLDKGKRMQYEQIINTFANQALRTICAGFKPVSSTTRLSSDKPPTQADGPQTDEYGLTLVAIFGIMDPVRPEVPSAVGTCMSAGITVRMVTGDNIATARAIAAECKILTENGIVMEGPVFRRLTEAQMDEILPKLQVLARSSPLDKQILVRNLKRLGETVAVTGDGTNDAPALKGSDVGFSMGITGTEVAKEASDIVILDDNFASIVKAVLWGRSVYDSVRKFLQFQLTVNVSAVVITIVTAVYTTIAALKPASALTAVQLLWVNLIMDTLAALALATDPPTPDLLNRKPSRRNERLVNFHMARMIVGQAIYQIVVCLVLYFGGRTWFTDGSIDKETGMRRSTSTVVFNAFVFCQVFNEVNSRSIDQDVNIFKGIIHNRIFLSIIALTVLLQALIVEFGGDVFHTDGLTGAQWGICLAVGAGSLPVGFLIRLLPDWRTSPDSDIELVPMEPSKSTSSFTSPPSTPSLTNDRWNTAIRRTQMQLRVVNAFRAPDGSIPPPRPQRTFSARSGEELWQRARIVPKSIGVVNAFRGGRRRNEGVTTLQMFDPSSVMHVRKGGDEGSVRTVDSQL
ncbi:calcium-translocating P-type ATPase, PMCA-type [Spizellomyces punctatus DAOM BR117]|uniref:Calcium-transporting ATPase n=1 Tax=Spizellomyces punctatus (strain DAOM BR117) TaxID=645134 RepID=A0A0L0H9L0_SPIPD|nr:calcium-translocating P-type ATPase, PMCA-type [Spizellomyces punctatus DAOM BR117]KNC97338.1 calcium-translocating P-type ATPase, PMCA-type [Spizellomyces punctatus DAOM BR117]|eukprot:XP_016605378.1 calcium-translocating P-type ATPase, PMCA-type [Spizellomyces punctatus DAOM BR117]